LHRLILKIIVDLFRRVENPLADLREPEFAAHPLIPDGARFDAQNCRRLIFIQ
jgi:hypothetical protein